MDGKDSSPWCVNNLDEFLFYCCPECDKRNKSKDLFLKHALGEHPEAQKYIEKFTIKEELIFNEDFVKDPKPETIDCEPNFDNYINIESG